MNKHPIEAKIIAFLDSCEAQPTASEFFNHFKNEPRLLEYLVISSLYVDYDAEGIINENYKYCKDSEKIESLIEEYGDFHELSEMFIPKNVISASIYKDFGNQEQAQELINWLMSNNYIAYYQELYSIKDLLFDGLINLEVSDCPMKGNELIEFLETKIEVGDVSSFSDPENQLNFDNFKFYHLNKYFKILQAQEAQQIISDYCAKRDLDLNPINNFNCFLSGSLAPDSVHLKVSLNGLKNLVEGVEVAKIKIKTDIGQIIKGFGSTVVKDQLADAITEYLVDKIPLAKEIKLGKSLLQSFISNMFEMTDISQLRNELNDHKDSIISLKTSLRDYYINHFLSGEFQIFFKENNLEYVDSELQPIFQRLYNTFVQSINSILTAELEEELLKGVEYKGMDMETRKFLMICDHLGNNRVKSKIGFGKFA